MFRGRGDSVASTPGLPPSWLYDEGLAWTAPIDGYGQSSPVIWNDRVLVTAAEGGEKESLLIACYGLSIGKRVWQFVEPTCQKVAVNDYVSRSAPTPVVDAERIYFLGKAGVATVVAAEPEYRKLSENRLSAEGRVNGIAAVRGALVLRTGEKLICVGCP